MPLRMEDLGKEGRGNRRGGVMRLYKGKMSRDQNHGRTLLRDLAQVLEKMTDTENLSRRATCTKFWHKWIIQATVWKVSWSRDKKW